MLRILGTGSTDADISPELYLCKTAVKTYISEIFMKLGVPNRVEAALYAFTVGLVTLATEPHLEHRYKLRASCPRYVRHGSGRQIFPSR